MALKPTIYKFTIAISDLDRHYYDTVTLTVAQHPSETSERMMARVLAYCFEAEEFLSFTKGLSNSDEPEILSRSLDDQLLHWIDMGEPAFDRMKKACRLAKKTSVYSFNRKSDAWWQQESKSFAGIPVDVYQFPIEAIEAMTKHLNRTLDFSLIITDNTAFLSFEKGEVEVPRHILQQTNPS